MKFALGVLVGSAITGAIGLKVTGAILQNPHVKVALKDAISATVDRTLYGDVTFAARPARPRVHVVR